MSKHLTGYATIKSLMLFSQLAKKADINTNGLCNLATYEDPSFFFDIIARTSSGYVNFCSVTPTNRSRYEVLCTINESGSTRWIKSRTGFIEHDGHEWFYEVIPQLQDPVELCTLTQEELQEVWIDVDLLNDDINKSIINNDTLLKHNKFFRDIGYFTQAKRTYPSDIFDEHARLLNTPQLYMNYADFEKSVELGYVGKRDGHYIFAGLQSIVPCPTLHNRVTSAMYLLANSHDVIEVLHNIDVGIITNIIDIHIRHMMQSPEYYTYDVEPHIARLKDMRRCYE